MAMSVLLVEEKLLYLSCRLNPDPVALRELKSLLQGALNWDKILSLGEKQETLPLVYYCLLNQQLQALIPSGAFGQLKDHYLANLRRNLVMEKELLKLCRRAQERGTNFLLLKGAALVQMLYPDPGLRIMADCDILIKPADLKAIESAFILSGYRLSPAKRDLRHMAIFSKELLPSLFLQIEAHGALAFPRPYEIYIPELWQRAKEKIVDQGKLLLLSPEDTFLSLALHLRSHTRRLNLKFIVDIAELLNAYGNSLDWQYILGLSRKNHIKTTLYFYIYLANELLQAKTPPPEILLALAPDILTRKLIRFTLNKYNFLLPKKWQGIFLRLLLFDRLRDLLLYFWRVCFLERACRKGPARNCQTR